MLFNSTQYLIFLPLVVILYYQFSPRARRILLLTAGNVFYGLWDWRFLGLLWLSTVVDFTVGVLLDRLEGEAQRKRCIIVSVIVNLTILGFFKYFNFFVGSFSDLMATFGLHFQWTSLHIILPVGVSFYTFQSLAYTIDVYRRKVRPTHNLLHFAVYVSFFPQLVAGPIERAPRLLHQLIACDSTFDWENIRFGLARILWGMFKKVYIADAMAHYANEAYVNPQAFSGAGLLLATYAFAAQIYCDFSGYSDIALGSARLLGIQIIENFDSPYLSCSIREFWRRWHISLSTWLRDYLYIPLGGSRAGNVRTYVNLMITMLLGGLWHGAAWTWVIWGGLQGLMMCVERLFNVSEETPKNAAVRLVRWAIVFHLVCLSWVFFRAHTLGTSWTVLSRILTWAPDGLSCDLRPIYYLGLILFADLLGLKRLWVELCCSRPALIRWVAYAAVLLLAMTFSGTGNPEFIYFQF